MKVYLYKWTINNTKGVEFYEEEGGRLVITNLKEFLRANPLVYYSITSDKSGNILIWEL